MKVVPFSLIKVIERLVKAHVEGNPQQKSMAKEELTQLMITLLNENR